MAAFAHNPPARCWFYYGWVNVVIAAIAMFATLPGRTQGLGLFTEPMLAELHLDRGVFANMNLWATLLGSLFCLPAGRSIDRFGARSVLTVIVLALGLTVWAFSVVQSAIMLFVLITLTRAIAQSALSVASIALVGKWFRRHLTAAMSVYSVLTVILFAVGFGVVGARILEDGWRTAWREIAMALLFVILPVAALLTRSTPESCGVVPDPPIESNTIAMPQAAGDDFGLTLYQALRTPAFWVFAIGTSLYGLVSSGLGLFNESIFAERGFDAQVYHDTLVITTLVSLAGQICAGFASRLGLRRLMALALFIYAGALLALPSITTLAGVRGFAVAMGMSGGIIMVVFFAVWGDTFGRAHLGRIQGAAQLLTVLASAIGPALFAWFKQMGSYSPAFYTLAPMVIAIGIAAWLTPTPRRTH